MKNGGTSVPQMQNHCSYDMRLNCPYVTDVESSILEWVNALLYFKSEMDFTDRFYNFYGQILQLLYNTVVLTLYLYKSC